MVMREVIIKTLILVRLYKPIARIRRLVLRISPLYVRRWKKIVKFFSQFVSEGDLCFDVGANIGDYTSIFLALGAKVVCIEPQQTCVRKLRQRFGETPNVTIVEKGLAKKEGTAEFFVCEDYTEVSTMSDKWRKESRNSNVYRWTKTEKIAVSTLDRLIKRYGLPVFCKIDVEGSEVPVIKGLSKLIPYISFEFTKEFLDDVKKCINHLSSIGQVEVNCCRGVPSEWLLPTWVTPEELYAKLESIKDQRLWGDIYVKSTHRIQSQK